MSLTDDAVRPAYVRRAKDHLVALKPGGDTHRDAHNHIVDYRLQDIMSNSARGVATVPGFCEDKPGFASPWHYHDCEMQIGIVMDGSVEMAFADGEFSRIVKGDIGMVPGGVVHDVSHPSADYLAAEFTFPGSFETIDAPPPPAGSETAASSWGVNAARRTDDRFGILFYEYPVPAASSQRYAVGRQRRSRVTPFEAHALTHGDEHLLLFVVQGTRTIRLDGAEEILGPGDLLVLPGGTVCTDVGASDEHEAITIGLRRRPAAGNG